MKHIFVTQSARTALVMRGAIKRLGIPPDDLIEIRMRGSSLSIPVSVSIHYRDLYFLGGRHKPSRLLSVSVIDLRIRKLCSGSPFTLYFAGPKPHFNQTLASSPLCQGLVLIEEGIGSCSRSMLDCDWGVPSALLGLARTLRIGMLLRFAPRAYDPSEIVHTYSILPGAFAWMPQNKRSQLDPLPYLPSDLETNRFDVLVALDSLGSKDDAMYHCRRVRSKLAHVASILGAELKIALSHHPDTPINIRCTTAETLSDFDVIDIGQIGIESESLILLQCPHVIAGSSSLADLCRYFNISLHVYL